MWICNSCTATLRQTVEQLPWLANQLALTFARQSRLTPAPSAARRRPVSEDDEESPLPFVPAARDRYDEIRTVLVRWVRDLCEQIGIEFTGSEPATIADLSAWLLAHLDRLITSEDAGLALGELVDVAERGIAAINRPVPPVYRGPCPAVVGTDQRGRPITCGVPLYAQRTETEGGVTVGADMVTCVRCGTTHDGRALEQKLLAKMSGYLMPADEILRVMRELGEPVAKSTWHNWRAKGKIQPRAWRHRGRIVNYWLTSEDEKLYRLDDVRALREAGMAATTARM
ncbi:hypothetical protein Y710_16470 [Gordonia sp. QH-12]|nr:hypothetical protein Y710_16470 [Gordonia sp. QH-12]